MKTMMSHPALWFQGQTVSFDMEGVSRFINPVITKPLISTFYTGYLPKRAAYGIAFPCGAQGCYPVNVRFRR